MLAVVAFFDMAAEGGGAADLDGAHNAQMFPRQRMGLAIVRAMLSKNIGHLKGWPWHRGYFLGSFGELRLDCFGLRTSESNGLGVPAMTCADTWV